MRLGQALPQRLAPGTPDPQYARFALDGRTQTLSLYGKRLPLISHPRESPLIDMRTSLFCLATAVSPGRLWILPDTLDPDDELLHEAPAGHRRATPAASDACGPKPSTCHPGPATAPVDSRQSSVRAPAKAPVNVPEQGGDIVFNFADQPIEAVINSVMGDLLHENYSIAEGVKGTVSFSTSKPVDKQQALSILETLLSWTDNAMIKQGNRYVMRRNRPAAFGKRLFSLRYISATEMQKLLKPFARENAFCWWTRRAMC